MSKTDIPEPERLLELTPGMAIWRVHLDSLREADVNAQVMSEDKFNQLAQNMKAEGALESLPLVLLTSRKPPEFLIISGHHRARSARVAGIMEIFVIVIERELSDDEITAKQLAHNALSGFSNPELLKKLYESIEDVNQRMASGLTELDVAMDIPSINVDDLDVEFEFEPIYIMFMKSGSERFEQLIDRLVPEAKKYVADVDDFKHFVATVHKISRYEDIRNIAGVMSLMMDIVDVYYEQREKGEHDKPKKIKG